MFASLAGPSEFEASIEAFSSPREFEVCDGRRSLGNGLIAAQQPRRPFHLSYRTEIGSPTDASAGYTIHLVYNAIAGPATRSHATQSDGSEAQTTQWNIYAMPPRQVDMRPTAHFIIDSRYTPAPLMEIIEGILYGTDITAPRIPLVAELVRIFAEYIEGNIIYGGTAASVHDRILDGGNASSVHNAIVGGGNALPLNP